MKHRKLRITWSVTWGLAAVLLVVLWVRSRDTADHWGGPITSANMLTIASVYGQIYVAYDGPPVQIFNGPKTWMHYSLEAESLIEMTPPYDPEHRLFGFGWEFRNPGESYFVFSECFLAALCAVISTAVWIPLLRLRFSLRTLLIATTLVAAGLGLIVWLR